MGHLPLELAEEILVRVPVKDLLCFRAVCKPWKTLIDSNSFRNNHFAQSARTHLIWHKDRPDPIPTITFLSANYQVSSPLPVDIHQFVENMDDRENMSSYEVGCVHGLQCLGYEKCYVIWNPSTKQHRVIEPPPDYWVGETIEELQSCTIAYFSAFGFDPKTQDYKFVDAQVTKEQGNALIQLYSLRTNSWKRIVHDFPFVVVSSNVSDGYLNGSYYWYAFICNSNDDGSSKPAIVRFDFTDETFKLISLPMDMAAAGRQGYHDTVCVTSRGCLEIIMVLRKGSGRWCEIWGMGDDESWYRKLRSSLSNVEVGRPMGIYNYSSVMFESKSRKDLVIFNTNNGSCIDLRIKSYWVFTYVESMFPDKL